MVYYYMIKIMDTISWAKTMKITIRFIMLLLAVAICVSCSSIKTPDASTSSGKPPELGGIAVGLRVEHTPNPVPAVLGDRSGLKYTWVHRTTVTALHDDVTITEFGAFVWHNGQWVFSTIYDRPFNTKEFAEWYSCPAARIAKGRSFSDPHNYTGGPVLLASKTKWYFIGRNSKGQQVKGEAVVEHDALVKD
jgi:hypothetical protein